MIGNDIVDLKLAEEQHNWERPGFLDKQFTKKEQQEIVNAENSFLKVWQFWSMKEAVYKCYTQKEKKRFFAPQKFECNLSSKEIGMVIFEGQKFYTNTHFNTFYIHTIAKSFLIENSNDIKIYIEVGHPNFLDKSIKLKLQDELGVLSSEIEKRKTKVGAPLFYHQQKLLTSSCSISHHGNYGAFAFYL